LSGRRVLDAGCGDGKVLLDLVRYGADPSSLSGVDLLDDRIGKALRTLPDADIRLGDAQSLPFPDASFDIVLAFTLLSSITEDHARSRVAREIRRVTDAKGLIAVYDFWLNPF